MAYSNGIILAEQRERRDIKHKVSLLSLMHKDKMFALLKKTAKGAGCCSLSAVAARILMSITNPALASLG